MLHLSSLSLLFCESSSINDIVVSRIFKSEIRSGAITNSTRIIKLRRVCAHIAAGVLLREMQFLSFWGENLQLTTIKLEFVQETWKISGIFSMNDNSEWKKYFVEEQEARDAENQKDAAAIESNIRGTRGGAQEKKKHMRDGTPGKGGEITAEGQNHTQGSHSLTKFIEQVWSILGGSRQIEDVSVNGNNVCCDDDQVAKVAHVIWELKEENSELRNGGWPTLMMMTTMKMMLIMVMMMLAHSWRPYRGCEWSHRNYCP